MPLTAFQKRVLAVLAANRSEASHFAGGAVLNAADDSARFSRDFDLFHDAMEDVAVSSEHDIAALAATGFLVSKVEWQRPAAFRKARVGTGSESVELDWAHDSAFRFFPIVADDHFGWRLHLFDAAVNKALALASRSETRDYVDIVEVSRVYPLEAIIWAACGKDPGFNPLSLLKMVVRFARIDPAQLEEIQARRLDPVVLKQEWIAATDRARDEITALADEAPETPIGVAFVDDEANAGWIRCERSLRVHRPTLRGCWPSMRPAK